MARFQDGTSRKQRHCIKTVGADKTNEETGDLYKHCTKADKQDEHVAK
jgi:hypothetical protein